MPFWTYMLHCRGGTFYVGHTDDIDRRIPEHQSGLIDGFTSDKLPVELVWSDEFATRDEALAAERQIKGWSRRKKLALIRDDWAAVSRHARSKDGPSTGSGQTEEGEALRLLIGARLIEQLLQHAASAHPSECCGILLGEGAYITAINPAPNAHPDPHAHFEIDPQALVDAHRAARTGGPQVLGYYHSHPNGLARPSATDRTQAAHDRSIWAIIADGGVTFWRDDEAGFSELSYAVEGA